MPINPSTGVFQRVWKFIDRFMVGDEVTREELDRALDDFVPAINAALSLRAAAESAATAAAAYAAQAAANGAAAGEAAGAAAAESAAALQTAAALAHAQSAELAKLAAQGFAASINPLNLVTLAAETTFAGDLDTLNPTTSRTTLYRLAAGVTNGPTGAGDHDFLLHLRSDADNATQVMFNAGQATLLAHRVKAAGVWGAWATVMTTNVDHLVTGGRTTTAVNDGTISTGTYTPGPSGGNMRRIVNNGAFTLAAPTAAGDYRIFVQITNGASAGTVTLSGFSRTVGSMTTTNGLDYLLIITKINGFTLCEIEALQ